MTIFKQLLVQLILILLNALFAATELAMVSINEKKVRAQAEDGDKKAKKLLRVIEDPNKFLSAIQVGITLAGFLGSAFAADTFAEMLTGFWVSHSTFAAAHAGAINTVSVVLITLVLSYFTLVLGELVPKRIAMKHKDKLARAMCGVISGLTTVLKPVIWFLAVSTNGVLRLFGINPHEKEEAVSEEDIVIMLDAGADEGTLKQDDIEYIKNVFKLEHLCAADVMTQRKSLVAVPRDIEEDALLTLIEEEGYSRIPVYEEDVDHIIGILHAKQYLLNRGKPDFKLEDVLMPPEYVPETARLDTLLKDMQDKRMHLCVVVNEYGMTIGVVSMEDIIEELLGEIFDEADDAEVPQAITQTGERTYLAQTDVSVDEFFSFFEIEKDESIESNTLNGWLTERCGCIPEVGYVLEHGALRITVTEADSLATRVVAVEVRETVEESDAEDGEKETV